MTIETVDHVIFNNQSEKEKEHQLNVTAMGDDNKGESTEDLLEKWKLVSLIIDRILMIMFFSFIIIVTGVMVTYVVLKSEEDFERMISEP